LRVEAGLRSELAEREHHVEDIRRQRLEVCVFAAGM